MQQGCHRHHCNLYGPPGNGCACGRYFHFQLARAGAAASRYRGAQAISFMAYFWAPSISGRTSTLPPLPAIDIDESFTDVIKDFDGGIMGSAELRFGRWGLLTDLMWSQVSPGGTLPGGASVGLRFRSLTVQADLLYRIYQDEPCCSTSVLACASGTSKTSLISPAAFARTIKISEGESWFSTRHRGQRQDSVCPVPWSFSLLGDIGGFDVGFDTDLSGRRSRSTIS